MERLLGSISELNDPRLDSGDSFVDKLNSRHTVYLFFTFAIILTIKQHYVGEPISCWHPAHFTASHEDYTDSLCWVNNTYYVKFSDRIPKENEPRHVIGYYQWTSLIITCQAILFYLPRVIWNTFNKKSGIEVTTITGAAIEVLAKTDYEQRSKTLSYMTRHMGRFLDEIRGHVHSSGRLKMFWYRLYGDYLAILYLAVKFLYLANVIFQLLTLDDMLGLQEELHGVSFLKRLFYSESQVESPLFPRVVFCDFRVRLLGNVHRYTLQCSLPVNLFNEKIFIFVWFWLVFVATATVASTLFWVWRAIYYPQHINYVKTRLITMDVYKKFGKDDRMLIERFVRSFLRRDGIFIIYFIGSNASEMVAAEVLIGLWQMFLMSEKQERLKKGQEVDIVEIPLATVNVLNSGAFPASKARPVPTAPPIDDPEGKADPAHEGAGDTDISKAKLATMAATKDPPRDSSKSHDRSQDTDDEKEPLTQSEYEPHKRSWPARDADPEKTHRQSMRDKYRSKAMTGPERAALSRGGRK